MKKNLVTNVTKSYHRCLENGDFWEDFYHRFMASSPDIRGKFLRTDFDKQKTVIQKSLSLLIAYLNDPTSKKIGAELQRLARLHDKDHLDVPNTMYNFWMKSLLEAVKKHDPQCSRELISEWSKCLSPIIEFMKSSY